MTLSIERTYDGKRVTQWRVSRGKAGEAVTVRTSNFGVFVCLTCISSDCAHAKAVEKVDRTPAAVDRGA